MRRVLMFCGVLVLLATGCGSSQAGGESSTPFANLPASEAVAESLTNATHAQSVKWVATIHIPGHPAIHLVSFAGVSSGYQTMRVPGGKTTVVLRDSTAYLLGTAAGLRDVFNFTPLAVTHLANRWISYTTTDTGYQDLAGGLTVQSVTQELGLHGTLRMTGTTTIAGQSVLAIHGEVGKGGKATLYISLDGNHLPVEEVITGHGTRDTTVFSQWNAVQLQMPKPVRVLAISDIRQASAS